MPVYDMYCNFCDCTVGDIRCSYEERHTMVCEMCGGTMTGIGMPAAREFKRGVYHDIGPDPIEINSARELKEACEKNDAISPYLEDSPYRRHLK